MLGYRAFGEAMLIIPKILCENSGFDIYETIFKVLPINKQKNGNQGINIEVNEGIDPMQAGIYDSYRVKK